MTSITAPSPAVRRSPGRLRTFWTTLRAVVTRELRWRMRGRRAFVVATVAVILMGLFMLLVHQALVDRAVHDLQREAMRNGLRGDIAVTMDHLSGAASVRVGRAIFIGLLALLTVITLMVAPALAASVISTEREHGTLEMLVTIPMSTLGLVLGKLIASLAYVLLLIAASVPLMCIAFAFGGIGPDDIAKAYLLVLAVAFGSAGLGLYLSALFKRTQVATMAAYLILLVLTVGSFGVYGWATSSLRADRQMGTGGDSGIEPSRRHARPHVPRAIMWLNPLAADLDIVCIAMPQVQGACTLAFSATRMDAVLRSSKSDTFWPRSAASFLVMGGVLTLLATQHLAPSRRIRLRRRRGRSRKGSGTLGGEGATVAG